MSLYQERNNVIGHFKRMEMLILVCRQKQRMGKLKREKLKPVKCDGRGLVYLSDLISLGCRCMLDKAM